MWENIIKKCEMKTGVGFWVVQWPVAVKFMSVFRRNRRQWTRRTKVPMLINKINVLNPTGHVMHQQFKIQQLYALPTLYFCVLYLFQNKQRLVPLTA